MATDSSEVNDHTRVLSSAAERCREIYEKQCRRIYSLALWMTNNKTAAQHLVSRTFLRALAFSGRADTEEIDQAFLAEVSELTPVEAPALDVTAAPGRNRIDGNIKQVHIERAVAQLPATERLIFLLHDVDGYDQRRISRLLRFSKDQVLVGLHRARMRIRELVARMQETTESGSWPTCTSF